MAFILIVLSSATGCWDRIEIEQRGFVVGAGIELPKEPKQEEDREATDKPKGKQRYALTYQFIVPGAMGAGTGGGNKELAYTNLTSTGYSMSEITKKFSTRTSRSPSLEHIKVILVSEELAHQREDFGNAVDFFIRFNQIRRNTKIFIVKGSPAKALKIKPEMEKITVSYIDSIAENHLKTGRMLKPFRMGELEERLLLDTSYAIPRLVVEEKEVTVAGAAVFKAKGNQMVGWLGEEETEGLNFLRDEIEGGVVIGKVGDNIIDFELKGSKRKIKLNDKDVDNLKFTIELDVEGSIAESLETMDYMKYPAVLKAQQSIEEEIKRLCEDTIHKLRDDFKVDVMGLGSYIKRHDPKLWNKVGKGWDTWENYFTKSSIDVKVNVVIRNPGLISESESDILRR